jgi:hypothetical protein
VIETVAYGEAVKSIRVSERKPASNRQALLDRFSKLYERAVAAQIESVTDYVIAPNMTDQEIISLGKELKDKVEAAEAFA